MVVHEVTLRVSLTPRTLGRALFVALMAALPRVSTPADLLSNISTLTTYFPSPAGYFEVPSNPSDPALVVTGNTLLARDGGDVQFGDQGNPCVRLIVGAEPRGTLPCNPNASRPEAGTSANLQVWGPTGVFNGTSVILPPAAGTLKIDGCIWLPSINLQAGTPTAATMYRCRWSRPVMN